MNKEIGLMRCCVNGLLDNQVIRLLGTLSCYCNLQSVIWNLLLVSSCLCGEKVGHGFNRAGIVRDSAIYHKVHKEHKVFLNISL